MGKQLVIAEKPSVGRELARVLGCNSKQNGYFEGKDRIITWALGHLVGLADPEHYGKEYQKWSLDTLPMLPKKMDLVVLPGSGKQYHIVEKLLRRKDVTEIIIATDAGREGELVARWILQKAGCKKPAKRLWISSQTDQAIRQGFRDLRPATAYDALARSAEARAEADWVVGLNVTRALTCRFNAQLSAGRVQTPTLAMIVTREEAIQAFRAKSFYTLSAVAEGLNLSWRGGEGGRVFDRDALDTVRRHLQGKSLFIDAVNEKKKQVPPPHLYDLTTLQRDANARYGFSAKDTLRIMQRLYEEYKLLTYPRTDSRYLSKDILPTLPDRLQALSSGRYSQTVQAIRKDGRKIAGACINDAKVSDHHAIIPTEIRAGSADLSSDEWKIYGLVVERFLGAFLGPALWMDTTIEARIEQEPFRARGRRLLAEGWQAVTRDMDDEEIADEDEGDTRQTLPPLKAGQNYSVTALTIKEGKTTPPKRFTEGSLLAAMENPQAFVADKRHRAVLQEAGGIGTPATRADIIEKLYQSFYIEKHGNHLAPTSKGRQLIAIVPDALRSPVLTAEWEERLGAISRGKEDARTFRENMRSFAQALVEDVKTSDKAYQHDNMTRVPCPLCGKYLLEVNTKRGKQRVCQDRECAYRETVSTQSNARCPNCHKKLVVIGQNEKRLYACNTCGFREKYDRFNERLKNKRSSSKQEVAKYMQKQKKEQDIGAGAFADAWSKALQDKDE